MAELQLAKDCEVVIKRGLKDLAERRKREAEKYGLLKEVADEFARKWPPPPVSDNQPPAVD
jgi:hypothetical protein